jgi:hypothetical protein
MLADLRRALRALRRAPGFFAAGVWPVAAPAPTPDPATAAALARFRGAYVAAVRGGAPDTILGADAEDVRLMPEFQKTVMGRAHAAAYHRAVAGGFAVGGYVRFLAAHAKELPVFETLDIRTDRIDDLGRYVIEYASHIAGFRVGDQSGVTTGKNTVISRREPGGALRGFRGMATYD